MSALGQEPRGVLLGIDHGAKVIGVAVCDASWIVARPLARLARTSRAADFAHINALIARHQARGVVVGIPETPADFKGQDQAGTVRRWATRLAAAVSVPVYTWDERLSTFEAERLRAEAGAEPVGRLDDRAAAVILQSFIDAHPPGAALPAPVKRFERD
jgi:putative Holliday junction resolvase